MSIEAMKQALATIDKIIDGCNNVQEEKDIHGDAKTLAKLIKKDCFPTLEALRQAIEFEEMVKKGTEAWDGTPDDWVDELRGGCQREWVGLTDEEVGTLTVFDGLTHIEVPILADFIRAIEAKLKEKNS